MPLESIEDTKQFSIGKMRGRERVAEDQTSMLRTHKCINYTILDNLDLPTIGSGVRPIDNREMDIEFDEKMVQASTIYKLPSPRQGRHYIFQTPVLPNFQSSKL
jgi:hypothetical protein